MCRPPSLQLYNDKSDVIMYPWRMQNILAKTIHVLSHFRFMFPRFILTINIDSISIRFPILITIPPPTTYLFIHIPINPIIYPELTGFSNSKRKNTLFIFRICRMLRRNTGCLSVVKLKWHTIEVLYWSFKIYILNFIYFQLIISDLQSNINENEIYVHTF